MKAYSRPLSISRRAVSERLAGSLMVTMRISEQTDLICLLGDGDESSTRSAVATWVEQQLASLDAEGDDVTNLLDYLISRLECRLNTINEGIV